MKNKIIKVKDAEEISKILKKDNKSVVITGGCFDILHVGHIKLLSESKKQGDFLFILLENDNNVEKLKGNGRPINNQAERAQVLAALECVDYVVLLPEMKKNKDYDNLIYKLKPDVITTTKGDPQGIHNERQAKKINAKVVYVINFIKNKSTTRIANIISEKFNIKRKKLQEKDSRKSAKKREMK